VAAPRNPISQTHSYAESVCDPRPIRTAAICTNPRCPGPRGEYLRGNHGEGWLRKVGRGVVDCPSCSHVLYWAKAPRREPMPNAQARRCRKCRSEHIEVSGWEDGKWRFQCKTCLHFQKDDAGARA
jgi:hypothetical protein